MNIMIKIITLMKRDIKFHQRWMFAGLTFPVLSALAILGDKETLFSLPVVFSVIFSVVGGTEVLLSRIFLEGASISTKMFLKTLPICRVHSIGGRYLVTIT